MFTGIVVKVGLPDHPINYSEHLYTSVFVNSLVTSKRQQREDCYEGVKIEVTCMLRTALEDKIFHCTDPIRIFVAFGVMKKV